MVMLVEHTREPSLVHVPALPRNGCNALRGACQQLRRQLHPHLTQIGGYVDAVHRAEIVFQARFTHTITLGDFAHRKVAAQVLRQFFFQPFCQQGLGAGKVLAAALRRQGMCSFLMSLGCNMAGVAGSRVIDNAGQRFLTMLLVWSIPCGTTLSLAPMLGGVFFGPMGSALVLVLMVVITIGSMYLAFRVFAGKLVDQAESHGLVMELPPYHKPKWGHIIRGSLMKAVDIFWRAFKMIYLVSIVFYLLSYPWGGNVSLLVRVGQVISPVTEFFGMTWQMFMAYLSSMLTKESLLGVINALYSNTDIAAAAFNAKSVGISDSIAALLPQVITKAQALGFIMAIVFNVPCTMTVAATYRENHSIKWIALSVGYYVAFSLAISCIFYHIGLLIW